MEKDLSSDTIRTCAFNKEKHFEQVLELYKKVFGVDAAKAYARRWSWVQEENPASENPACWVLVSKDIVFGFLGTVPQRLECQGKTLLVHSSADFFVDPTARFHGLKLMREFRKHCAHSVSLEDVEDTIGILKWQGCTVIGEMQRYVKILDLRLAARYCSVLASIPQWAVMPINKMLNLVDVAMGMKYPRVVSLSAFDGRFDRFAHVMTDSAPIFVKHDSAYLNWRYGNGSPHANPVIGGVLDAQGELMGFVVGGVACDTERSGVIFELEYKNGDGQIAEALLRFAARRLRDRGAWKIRYHRLVNRMSISHESLTRYGFSVRPGKYQLLVGMGENDNDERIKDINNWRYSFGDGEPSHSFIMNRY